MKKNTFTMIEMVVVCAILLFLTAGLFAVGNVLFKKYYNLQGKMEFLKIQNGLAAYKSTTGDFPPDYMSSSQNENDSGNGVGGWQLVIAWLDNQKALDFYNKFAPPAGCPKALVRYNGGTFGVWVWNWGSDFGGELPVEQVAGVKSGYVCQNKKPVADPAVADHTGAVKAFFGVDFPRPPVIPNDPGFNSPDLVLASAINVQHCGSPDFKCEKGEKDNPDKTGSGEVFSCGWHNKIGDIWEGSYDQAETGKALYDYLCRPMKGRMKEGQPTNPKYENSKPFIEVGTKLTRQTGKAPSVQCDGSLTNDTAENYKRWGEGLYNMTDSYELIDVWGQSYLFISSANEYTTPSDNSVPPYKAYFLSEFGNVEKTGFKFDLYPPYYNPASYDLASKGSDGKYQNYIPMDYKIGSTSGYAKNLEGGSQGYIFGQDGEGGAAKTYFFVLPSEDLRLTDFDNDNISNFSQNAN
jgi:hypothetical protein